MIAPLIAPKPFSAFTADEYHAYITAMWAMPAKRGTRPCSPVSGLSVSRNKKGTLTVRRTAKNRPFAYATTGEVTALAKHVKCPQAELWNLLKAKDFILGPDRLTCEKIYAEIQQLPF
jgi:hypothetical protein